MTGIYFGLQVQKNDAALLNRFTKSLGIRAFKPEDMLMTVLKCKHGEGDGNTDYPVLPEPITLEVGFYQFFHNIGMNIQAGVSLELKHIQPLMLWRHDLLAWVRDNEYGIVKPNGKLQAKYRNNEYNPHISISYDKRINDKVPYSRGGPFIYRKNLIRQKPITVETLTFDTIVTGVHTKDWGNQYK